MMLSAGIPGLTKFEDIYYLREVLENVYFSLTVNAIFALKHRNLLVLMSLHL